MNRTTWVDRFEKYVLGLKMGEEGTLWGKKVRLKFPLRETGECFGSSSSSETVAEASKAVSKVVKSLESLRPPGVSPCLLHSG